MSDQDQRFINQFMVVIGVLVGVTLFLIAVARTIGSNTQLSWTLNDPANRAMVAERIAPFGKVALPGDAAPEGAGQAEAAQPVAAKLSGPQVYNGACLACHGAGIGGAPKIGDQGSWAPRIAQGMATLNKHALEGFTGQAGYMPPKGGRVDLSDEEILAAVEYMVGQSR